MDVTSQRPVSCPWWSVFITGTLLFLLLPTTVLSQANNGNSDFFDLLGTGQRNTPTPWARDKYEEEAGQTFNLVFHKYNHLVRPPQEYVNVTVEVSMLHLKHVDVQRGEMQVVVGMEMIWFDSRLVWIPDRVFQIMGSTNTVWSPDIVFINSVAPSQQLLPNLLRIKQDGTISWTRKEVVTTSCDTDPASDVQTCFMKLGFMSNIRDRQMDRFIRDDTSKVVTSEEFQNPEWDLTYLSFTYDTDNDTTLPFEMDIEVTWSKSANSRDRVADLDNSRDGSGNPAYGVKNGLTECGPLGEPGNGNGGGDRNSAPRSTLLGMTLRRQAGGDLVSAAFVVLLDLFLVAIFRRFSLHV